MPQEYWRSSIVAESKTTRNSTESKGRQSVLPGRLEVRLLGRHCRHSNGGSWPESGRSIPCRTRHVDRSPMREFEWTRPKLVTQIRFVEWTADGRLRHAAFQGRDRRRLLARYIGSFEIRIRIAGRTSLVDRALLSADHDSGLSASADQYCGVQGPYHHASLPASESADRRLNSSRSTNEAPNERGSLQSERAQIPEVIRA
jgi:hypothetical protein